MNSCNGEASENGNSEEMNVLYGQSYGVLKQLVESHRGDFSEARTELLILL